MHHDRIKSLAESGGYCRIFTPFGEATGQFTACDGEDCTFLTLSGHSFRLFCVDVLGLTEDVTVPTKK